MVQISPHAHFRTFLRLALLRSSVPPFFRSSAPPLLRSSAARSSFSLQRPLHPQPASRDSTTCLLSELKEALCRIQSRGFRRREMADLETQGNEYEQKAEKKLKGWGLFGSKYDDAAELLEKAGNSYKLGKSWDKAAQVYIKLANCHLKLESKHEAASAYVDAANCYKKTQPQEAIKSLNTGVQLYMEIGRLSMAAKYLKDIAEIYGKEEDAQKAMEFYERAADLYSGEEANSTGNQCRIKVAEYAAELEQYPKAIEIYEVVARQSLDSNLLKYSVKGYLLNAGLCHLCSTDSIAIQNALEKYQDLDPTFGNTRECKFLNDLAGSVEEVDVGKFTDIVKEFDSMSRLDQWKTMLLLRTKNALKAKEDGDDDLT